LYPLTGNNSLAWHVVLSMQNIIISDPEILSGTPVFRGTRVPVKNLFDYLETGETIEAFLHSFPTVSREQAIAALELSEHLLIRSDPSLSEVIA
jgi:uncharacterized protein (DUF433 family)